MKNYSNAEEHEILDAFENGKLKKSKKQKEEITIAQEAAANTIMKTKLVNVRLTEKEIAKLKAKALETGMSYQNLINALIHQYLENRISLTL